MIPASHINDKFKAYHKALTDVNRYLDVHTTAFITDDTVAKSQNGDIDD